MLNKFDSILPKIDKLSELADSSELIDDDLSCFLSGLFVVMSGYFEVYINQRIADIQLPQNELQLLNVFNNIKSHLKSSKEINIKDLVNWYRNPVSDNFNPYVRFSDKLNDLQIFLALQNDDAKKQFNKLINDYKKVVLEHRHHLAHGVEDSILATDKIKFNSAKDLIKNIIQSIESM